MEKTVKKKMFVYAVDFMLSLFVISMFFFIDQLLILFVMAGIMALVLEHYLIMRNCYLEEK